MALQWYLLSGLVENMKKELKLKLNPLKYLLHPNIKKQSSSVGVAKQV